MIGLEYKAKLMKLSIETTDRIRNQRNHKLYSMEELSAYIEEVKELARLEGMLSAYERALAIYEAPFNGDN